MSGSLLDGRSVQLKGQALRDMSRAAACQYAIKTATVETGQYFCASQKSSCSKTSVFPALTPGFLDSAGLPYNSAIKEFVTARKLQEHSVVTGASAHPD